MGMAAHGFFYCIIDNPTASLCLYIVLLFLLHIKLNTDFSDFY
jgi:hypothetical protein